VVESISVHEDIKTGGANADKFIQNYKESLKRASTIGGVKIFCYNFMPVVDWTRTELDFEVKEKNDLIKTFLL